MPQHLLPVDSQLRSLRIDVRNLKRANDEMYKQLARLSKKKKSKKKKSKGVSDLFWVTYVTSDGFTTTVQRCQYDDARRRYNKYCAADNILYCAMNRMGSDSDMPITFWYRTKMP